MHNCIQLTVPIDSSLEELIEWNQILSKILIYAFSDRPAYILTLSPQKYSLGYELEVTNKIKIEKKEFLINYCNILSYSLIQKIIESEEFERGLIKIIPISHDQLEDVIKSIPVNYNELDKFDYELIEMENDGKMFCWLNPHLPMNDIDRKLQEIGVML